MQSSYQYHFGGQAAAAKGSSPAKSTDKAQAAASSSSGMFAAKVDWGTGSSAAAQPPPFGFSGGSSFGGPGATASQQGSRPAASFGGPTSNTSGLQLGSQSSANRAPMGTGASFGVPTSSSSMSRPGFGGAAASGTDARSSAFGFSAQNWAVEDATRHVTTSTSVKEYAYAEDKNQRFRPQMEDTNCIVDKVIPNDPSTGLFAIFDGHGGRQVSDYCAERFPLEVKKELAKTPADLTQCLTDVFLKVNNELRLLDSDGCGSTACVAVVRKEGANNILYLANVGDSRAVLSKSGHAERLSIDDKCDNPEENARIKSGGGIILDNRLGGVLAVTRAFGDHALTRVGLIATPHIVKYTLKPFDKYLVIASDGIWDELSDQDAISLCQDDISTKQIAQTIVKTALNRGSKDNISVIVIKFNGATGNMY